MEHILDEVYDACTTSNLEMENFVKGVYRKFTYEEISDKVAQIVTSDDIVADVQVIFQTVENLHKCIPNHTGDWYFTGNYPTPGGNKVVNKPFINYIEGRNVRAY